MTPHELIFKAFCELYQVWLLKSLELCRTLEEIIELEKRFKKDMVKVNLWIAGKREFRLD